MALLQPELERELQKMELQEQAFSKIREKAKKRFRQLSRKYRYVHCYHTHYAIIFYFTNEYNPYKVIHKKQAHRYGLKLDEWGNIIDDSCVCDVEITADDVIRHMFPDYPESDKWIYTGESGTFKYDEHMDSNMFIHILTDDEVLRYARRNWRYIYV